MAVLVLVSPRDIARRAVLRVAIEHQIPVADIMGRAKFRFIMAARHQAYRAVAEKFPHWSVVQVGNFFRRDHTTILYSFRRSGYVHPGAFRSAPRKICQDLAGSNSQSQEHSKSLLPVQPDKHRSSSRCQLSKPGAHLSGPRARLIEPMERVR